MVGEWSTVSIRTNREDEPPDNGAGVSIRFERDGRMTIDYTGMKPLIDYLYNPKRVGKTSVYIGRSVSYIRIHPDKTVEGTAIKESNVVVREQDDEGNVLERKLDGISGQAVIDSGYTCSANTLFWSAPNGSRTTLKRKS